MLRNLNQEFRGNGLPDEPHSRLARGRRDRAYEERVQPHARGVKIRGRRWAAQSAAATGAGATVRAGAVKARTVHQTSSKELAKVLGHRCLKPLRRR